MPLKEYRRKRNFNKTPEPAGKSDARGARRGPLRFVVQKHEATRLHYDLRLEMGGTFKSWAVPRGPSLNPLDQRLALQVEEHPIEYGSFEGIIPRGNYGAGTVMVWDEGTYEPREAIEKSRAEKKILEGFARGKLTFVLHGEKLNGEFALVRLRRAKQPNAWLLLKKRDRWAVFREAELDDRSVVSDRSMRDIARDAERSGAVWIPKKGRQGKTKTRALPVREKNRPVLPEGTRLRAGRAKIASIPRRVKAMQAVMTTDLPASGKWIYCADPEGVRAIAEIDQSGVKLYSRSLLPLGSRHPTVLSSLRRLGGQRVVDGEIRSEGRTERFVASDLLYSEGKDLRDLPLDARLRALEKALGGQKEVSLLPHFDSAAKAMRSARRERAGFIVAKRADSPYQSGLSRDWIKARLPESEAEPEASESRHEPSDRPPLTHLDKIYFPKEKISKGDLVAYYEEIAPYIVPHLKGRPESLHRQPDGVKNAGFFHKDMTGYLPRRVRTHRVYSRSGGKTVNYLVCDDVWTLLYMANLGCIEINPWLSRVESLDRPDYAVIDLDPDGNSFEEVVEVALEMRRVLRMLGADGWCKTSGATGLHIYLPIGARHDYDTARELIEGICRLVHERFPKNTSVERNPARRRRKIYLDFLQNRRGQTMAAPYCVRPAPGATVSTPLRWSEVRKGLDPSRFTLRTVPARLKRLGDLWADIDSKAIDVEACLKKLARLTKKSS